ncbi:MAG: PTS sugar transporter subunit IIA [Bacillota bacterium]|nr:PTS sugar transporter subunit IIA [Bacillota bacterium]
MADRAIVIMTHGEFGSELIKSVEMIMGPQENVCALALRPGDSVDNLRNKAALIVEKNNEKGLETVVMVDLMGGSPGNVALSLLAKNDLKILTGVNMPMLIELLAFYKNDEDTNTLLETIKQTGMDGIKKLDRSFFLKK